MLLSEVVLGCYGEFSMVCKSDYHLSKKIGETAAGGAGVGTVLALLSQSLKDAPKGLEDQQSRNSQSTQSGNFRGRFY